LNAGSLELRDGTRHSSDEPAGQAGVYPLAECDDATRRDIVE
jgi:hypothetical protein